MATPVQSATPVVVSAGTSLTIALTGVTAGNCLILTVSYFDNSQGTSAVPTAPTYAGAASGTATTAIAPACLVDGGSGGHGAAIYFVPNIGTPGTYTFTVNPYNHAGQLYAEATLVEWPGLTTTPLDKTSSASVTTDAGTGNTGTTSTLTQSNELVVAAMTMLCSAGTTTANISSPATTGYTSLAVNQDTQNFIGVQHSYKEAGSSSGQIATWTWDTGKNPYSSAYVIATFLENSVPPLISIKRSVVQLDTTIYY